MEPSLPSVPGTFRIGEILVHPDLHEVQIAERRRHLEPKVMGVLVALARSGGAAVSRQELIAEVWEGAFVSDETLTMAVSKLRRALGDDPRSPRLIATIPKRGYRLLIEAEVWTPEAPEPPDPGAGRPDSATSPSGEQPFRRALGLGIVLCGLLLAGLALRWQRTEQPGHSSPGPAASTSTAPKPWPVRPLTSMPGREMFPALSPDGRFVVFAAVPKEGGHSDLFLQAVDGEGALRLTDDPAVEARAAWSPDSSEIAFFQIAEGSCKVVRLAIWNGRPRPIADCASAARPDLAWSPDGDWLAWPERSAEGRGIGLVLWSFETGGKAWRTDPPLPGATDSHPAFSPDGRLLAFERAAADGRGDLWTVPVTGGDPRRITSGLDHLWGHTWARDGRSLIFSSLLGETFALFRIDIDPLSEPRWLPIPGSSISRDPTTARTDDGLVFEDWSYHTNIWRTGDGSQTDHPLIASTAWDSAPAFSPDGQHLAFLSNRAGVGGVWIARADGSEPRRIASRARFIESVVRWSPDGTRLVFLGGTQTDTELRIVDVETARVRSLGAETRNARAPAWSIDGQSIYFGGIVDGEWQIHRLHLASGHQEQVTSAGGLAAQESPDGEWLYLSRPRTDGLWRRRTTGGDTEQVLGDLDHRSWGNWFPTSEGVVYSRLGSLTSEVVEWNRASGRTTVLRQLPRKIPNPGLARSPDGRHLLYSCLENSESDLRWTVLPPAGTSVPNRE